MRTLTNWLERFAVAIDLKKQNRRLLWFFVLMIVGFAIFMQHSTHQAISDAHSARQP